MNKTTFRLQGSITAISPLAVSRPGDNFPGGGHSDKTQRLPRAGAKQQHTPVFFPASTLRGVLRRASRDVVRHALIEGTGNEKPFSLDTHYMLTQGVDVTDQTIGESTSGLIEEEGQLRAENPLLSLWGRWKLPGHLSIGDAIPRETDGQAVSYVAGTGARTDDFARSPMQAQFLSPEDAKTLNKILVDDALKAKGVAELKDEVKELKKNLRSADPDEKKALNAQLDELESQIDTLKKSKQGSQESIQRPLDGYEVIRPGVEMDQAMVLMNATDMELGLLIAALAEFSRHPYLGAHFAQGCGEISAEWTVTTRPVGWFEPVLVGTIVLSSTQFEVRGEVLQQALAAWQSAVADGLSAFNFERFLLDEKVADKKQK